MHSSTSSDDELDDVIAYSPYATDNELDDVIAYSPYATDSDVNIDDEPSPPRGPEQAGNEPQQCKLCHAIVPTMRELIVHFLLHHEVAGDGSLRAISKRESKALPDVQQKYVCGMCGVECFDTMRETKRHMFEEHGYRDEEARDSGADYSSDDHSDGSTDTNVSVEGSDNDSIDGVSSGMVSEMSSSTQYVSSPDSRRTRGRSYSLSSSEYEPEQADRPGEFENYLRSITLKSLMAKFKSELYHKCSRKGCQYKFVTSGARERHLQCHTEDNEPGPSNAASGGKRKRFSFKCTQCEQRFDSWKPCLLHLWHNHQIDLGMMQCPVCDKRFGYVVHVFNHLQTHRPRSMREIQCRICSQRFANNAQRSVHEALHRKKGHHMTLDVVQEEEEMACEPREVKLAPKTREPKPKRPVKRRTSSSRLCKLCKRMFANAKILSKHVQTVHLKIKPFICNVCGYKCARKVTLNIHMRQHSGVKPLACQSCSFQTADPSALHYHKRRHQREKLYKCRTCGFNTVQPTVLKQHIQRRHPQEYERIKCRLCSYASINAQNLRRHVAEHDAGLIVGDERENDQHEQESHASPRSVSRMEVKNVPEISLDCFLPPESADSVVHDAGGITIPAVDGPVPVAHSEDTQFPL